MLTERLQTRRHLRIDVDQEEETEGEGEGEGGGAGLEADAEGVPAGADEGADEGHGKDGQQHGPVLHYQQLAGLKGQVASLLVTLKVSRAGGAGVDSPGQEGVRKGGRRGEELPRTLLCVPVSSRLVG